VPKLPKIAEIENFKVRILMLIALQKNSNLTADTADDTDYNDQKSSTKGN
jgi:hypothetical protein